jgi:hypothetical protein
MILLFYKDLTIFINFMKNIDYFNEISLFIHI